MSNARFSRDEVILALDTFYFSGEESLTANSDAIKELCSTLQKLPIHPFEKRYHQFRSETGVAQQLYLFKTSCRKGTKHVDVGEMFFTVAHEFENDLERLHAIAESIRRNLDSFENAFGSVTEDEGFPEGVLLGHYHRAIERRDGTKLPSAERCSICQLEPEMLYLPCGSLLEQHLLVDPVKLDSAKKYKSDSFITVCPTCHAALHRVRPWLGKTNYNNLLR